MAPNSQTSPSQTVERIREIIVGRHLEKLETRVHRLESSQAGHQHQDERFSAYEAQLESLRSSIRRIADSSRQDAEARNIRHQEEISRLASQIQQSIDQRNSFSAQPAVDQLERKIGSWLNHWQGSLQTHLSEREQNIVSQLKEEIAKLESQTNEKISQLESKIPNQASFEARFQRIAKAAQALADSVAPAQPLPNS